MSKTERPARYVAYYRMPSIGPMPLGETLARQRRDVAAFLDHPDKALVGEFTEVMTPAHEGETSPAFDLSLECCRNLDASLICALTPADLSANARKKAAGEHIEIILVDGPSDDTPAMGTIGLSSVEHPDEESVPYLPLGRGRQRPPMPLPGPSGTITPAGNRAKADRFAAAVLPIIEQIRESGATTLTDIAEALNARNIRTARGTRWYPTTVKNILDRQARGDDGPTPA